MPPLLVIIGFPAVAFSSIIRKGFGIYNGYATENNSDSIVEIQKQIEINNRNTIRWSFASVLLGGLFFWL